MKQGPYCNVSHTNQEIKRLVKTLVNRDFGPDDLLFLKIKTYTDGKRLEIRTSTAYSHNDGDLYWIPHPFAFIKNHVKGKFKFLPIRLHQFEDLWKGHEKESLKADDYPVTKPWTMEINLNINWRLLAGDPYLQCLWYRVHRANGGMVQGGCYGTSDCFIFMTWFWNAKTSLVECGMKILTDKFAMQRKLISGDIRYHM